jgi:transketolase
MDHQMDLKGFPFPLLPAAARGALEEAARVARRRVLLMTTTANSGHPAGSLSSLEMDLIAYATANLRPENLGRPDRDRVIVSHGHTSPGVYAALAAFGFLNPEELTADFRRAGSGFPGHVERIVPGVDWGTGNLGQGLAAAVGFALADRAKGVDNRTFVLMGDGEQVKGQVAEARRIARKEKLSRITALVDLNRIQISGRTDDVMPADLRALWEADGWRVLSCDGHDFEALYGTLLDAALDDMPSVILCRTLMGRGISFMEDTPDYHGKVVSGKLFAKAAKELRLDPEELSRAKARRALPPGAFCDISLTPPNLDPGTPVLYPADAKSDNRSAFGRALREVADLNDVPERTPLLVFDCDLASSVKTDGFATAHPGRFIETGIQEHATAAVAGAAAAAGVVALWADFGVFGLDEAYNQQRLNDINRGPLKLILTHCGLDVGEDGMTHQCIDYVGLLRNLFGFRLVVPADPNQTDRALRWALLRPEPVCIALGRSRAPVVTREDGSPLFDGEFRYGALDRIREGSDAAILAMGRGVPIALEARELLASEEGISVSVLGCACPLAIDPEELFSLIGDRPLVTVEDHHVETGLFASAALAAAKAGRGIRARAVGVSRYGESGDAEEIMERMDLSAVGAVEAVISLLRGASGC